MARATNQKLKLMHLYRILLRETDEQHPMSIQQMIDRLAELNIPAERKSIYDDLEALQNVFNVDIVTARGRGTCYYVGNRDFQLPEVRLLMDCVESSKFVTAKKTRELLDKLGTLVSMEQEKTLNRQTYIRNRVKSENEEAYYSVDALFTAIDLNRKVSFQYSEYGPDKKLHKRKNGRRYKVSPMALLCDDDQYYLLAWSDSDRQLRHYRVDRMSSLEQLAEPRSGLDSFQALDLSGYTKRVFGMFSGEEVTVTMSFPHYLANAVIDRFGRDVPFEQEDSGHFTVTAPISISAQFYGWLFGLGPEAKILAPESIRQRYQEQLEKAVAAYL